MTKLDEMHKELMAYDSRREETDIVSMLGTLRDFLDIEVLNEHNGWDTSGELVAGPEFVVYYAAQYIELLKAEIRLGRVR